MVNFHSTLTLNFLMNSDLYTTSALITKINVIITKFSMHKTPGLWATEVNERVSKNDVANIVEKVKIKIMSTTFQTEHKFSLIILTRLNDKNL